MLCWSLQLVTCKDSSLEQERTVQEVQPAVQAAMLLGTYSPADPVGLEVLLRKDAI